MAAGRPEALSCAWGHRSVVVLGTSLSCRCWRHLSDSLAKGAVFAPAAAEQHGQTGERRGGTGEHSFGGEPRSQLELALKLMAGF